MGIDGIGGNGYEIGKSIVYTANGAIKFDREMASKLSKSSPSFGTALTREELLNSIDEQIEKNQKLYGKTEADWIKEWYPDNWATMRFRYVGESKSYSYYEWIKERENCRNLENNK